MAMTTAAEESKFLQQQKLETDNLQGKHDYIILKSLNNNSFDNWAMLNEVLSSATKVPQILVFWRKLWPAKALVGYIEARGKFDIDDEEVHIVMCDFYICRFCTFIYFVFL